MTKKHRIFKRYLSLKPRSNNILVGTVFGKVNYAGEVKAFLPHFNPINDEIGLKVVFNISENAEWRRNKVDLDNLVKALCDVLTGIVWVDDSQIQEIYAKINRHSKNEGINLEIYTTRQFLSPNQPDG